MWTRAEAVVRVKSRGSIEEKYQALTLVWYYNFLNFKIFSHPKLEFVFYIPKCSIHKLGHWIIRGIHLPSIKIFQFPINQITGEGWLPRGHNIRRHWIRGQGGEDDEWRQTNGNHFWSVETELGDNMPPNFLSSVSLYTLLSPPPTPQTIRKSVVSAVPCHPLIT